MKNVNINRNMFVDGSITACKNVVVKGFLDAPNIRGCSKGLFLSRDELIANYPRPHRGWWAVVCNSVESSTAEGELFMALLDEYERPVWTDVGKSVDLSNLIDRFQPIEEQIEEINQRLDAIAEKVAKKMADIESRLDESDERQTTLEERISTLADTIEEYRKEMVTDVEAEGTDPLTLSATKDGNKVKITGSVDLSQFNKDRKKLALLWKAIASGRINNGTERFNGVLDSSTVTCVFSSSEPETDYDGILWLSDKKIFVAYRATVRMDCNAAYITYYFYTTWDTAYLYMQTPGKEAALWQDKVYVYGGGVYVWANCDNDLVLAGGGSGQSLSNSLSTDATLPLHLEFLPVGDGLVLYGYIEKATSTSDGLMSSEDKARLDEIWEKYQDGDFNCPCGDGGGNGGDGDGDGEVTIDWRPHYYQILTNCSGSPTVSDTGYSASVTHDSGSTKAKAFDITLPWHIEPQAWQCYAGEARVYRDGVLVESRDYTGAGIKDCVTADGVEVTMGAMSLVLGGTSIYTCGRFEISDNLTDEERLAVSAILYPSTYFDGVSYDGDEVPLTINQEAMPEGAEFGDPVVELEYPKVSSANYSNIFEVEPTYSYEQPWSINGEEQDPLHGNGKIEFALLETYTEYTKDGITMDSDGVVSLRGFWPNNTGAERTLAVVQMTVTARGKTTVVTANVVQESTENTDPDPDTEPDPDPEPTTEYDAPVVELSYPNNVPYGGGESEPTLSYSQKWRIDGVEQTPITSGAEVTYELVENLNPSLYDVEVDESTGVVTAKNTAITHSDEVDLCSVKATVKLNGESGEGTATVRVAASDREPTVVDPDTLKKDVEEALKLDVSSGYRQIATGSNTHEPDTSSNNAVMSAEVTLPAGCQLVIKVNQSTFGLRCQEGSDSQFDEPLEKSSANVAVGIFVNGADKPTSSFGGGSITGTGVAGEDSYNTCNLSNGTITFAASDEDRVIQLGIAVTSMELRYMCNIYLTTAIDVTAEATVV